MVDCLIGWLLPHSLELFIGYCSLYICPLTTSIHLPDFVDLLLIVVHLSAHYYLFACFVDWLVIFVLLPAIWNQLARLLVGADYWRRWLLFVHVGCIWSGICVCLPVGFLLGKLKCLPSWVWRESVRKLFYFILLFIFIVGQGLWFCAH